MPDFIQKLIDWVNAAERADLWAAVAILLPLMAAAGATTKVVPKLFRKTRQAAAHIAGLMRTRRELPGMLQGYKAQLERSTLGVRHAWMPDDKTILTFLVPVLAQSDDEGQIDVFNYFLDGFRDRDRKLVVLTGAPGSGKSVSLAVVARAAWESYEGSETGGIGRMASYVPIMLRFADLARMSSPDTDTGSKQSVVGKRIEAALLKSLEIMLFAHGNVRAQAVREQFLSQLIADHRLLIIVDGLDEVSRADRHSALQDLVSFVGTSHFCVIGCRDEVYPEHRQLLEAYGAQRLRLPGFTQVASERFLRKWAMVTGLSTSHVLDYLADRRALRKIVENPLLLTIACFLGAKEQATVLRRATDFYRECTGALLANWGREGRPGGSSARREAYERPILKQLARWWLSADEGNPAGIPRDKLYRKFRGWLRQELGTPLPAGMEVSILDDLLVHAGILVAVDNLHVDFLHRTFLEYLAADYYANTPAESSELMLLWKSDPVRFGRTALFYCGLAGDAIAADQFIAEALQRGDIRFAVSVMAEARGVSERSCSDALDAVRREIERPSEGLIESLGELSRCSMPAIAAQAQGHLKSIVDAADTQPQLILESALREIVTDTPEGIAILMACADFVRLPLVISGLSIKTIASAGRRMVADQSQPGRIRQWIECLRNAERLGELCSAFIDIRDDALRAEAALALVSLSESDGFWHALDRSGAAAQSRLEGKQFERWGWPHTEPETEHGKRLAVEIAQCLAATLTASGQFPFSPLPVRAHRWMYFLTHALAWEHCYSQEPVLSVRGREAIKMPIVGVMFRSLPRLVRRAWMSPARLRAHRRLGIARIGAGLLGFAPGAMLGISIYDLTRNARATGGLPFDSLMALSGLVIADILAWSLIATDSRPRYERTVLDTVIATLLGPACVFRELPNDVRYKRRDDFVAVVWTVALLGMMTGIAILSSSLVYAVLAVLVGVDAIIQANSRIGASALLARQFAVMTDFLSRASRSSTS